MKDALLQKNGIVKVWWDTRHEEKKEEYKALDQVELAQVMDDPEVEITEQTSYPDEDDAKQRQEALSQMMEQLQQAMQAAQQGNPQAQQAVMQMQQQIQQIQSQPPVLLYDITAKRVKTGGKITIENVPPEGDQIENYLPQQIQGFMRPRQQCGHACAAHFAKSRYGALIARPQRATAEVVGTQRVPAHAIAFTQRLHRSIGSFGISHRNRQSKVVAVYLDQARRILVHYQPAPALDGHAITPHPLRPRRQLDPYPRLIRVHIASAQLCHSPVLAHP